MINVELLTVEWIRADAAFDSDYVMTLLADQTVADPWPDNVVRAVKTPFTRPDHLSWQERKVFESKAQIVFHCYSKSQKQAFDLWSKVCDRVLSAPFARNIEVLGDGIYAPDENVELSHINRYIGNVMLMVINT